MARIKINPSGLAVVAAAVAVVWVNSPFQSTYYALWKFTCLGLSVHGWINDGFITLFFLIIGLEIRNELRFGEISSPKKARLPLAAALGGMIAPAIIYLSLNSGKSFHGWGIPIATDIVFSLAILNLIAPAQRAARVLLMGVAIVDDIGAIAVIAFFYTGYLDGWALAAGILVAGLIGALTFFKFQKAWGLGPLGVLLWVLFFKSGVHPTVAGVLFAFIIPGAFGERIENYLKPWVDFIIIPLFALANAGAVFSVDNLVSPIAIGVTAGLFIGKPVGITMFSWLAVRLGLAELPAGLSWRPIVGLACLGGIGFTVSMFISELAFSDHQSVGAAKVGILLASLLSALAAGGVFSQGVSRPRVASERSLAGRRR